jgi:hypothetical protein
VPNHGVEPTRGTRGGFPSRFTPAVLQKKMMMQQMNIWCLVLAVVAIVGCATPPAEHEAYLLTVKLQDPYNRDVTITVPVIVNQPFVLTSSNEKVQNTVSGVLKPPVSGRFPLELTVSEWESEKSNIRDTTQLTLDLDKPWSGGLVSSFVYLRTVTLSKKSP